MCVSFDDSPLFWHKIFAQNSALLKFVVFFFHHIIIMYLMYYLNEDGKRVYTLKVRKLYMSHRSLCEYESQKLGFVSSFFLSLLEHTAE